MRVICHYFLPSARIISFRGVRWLSDHLGLIAVTGFREARTLACPFSPEQALARYARSLTAGGSERLARVAILGYSERRHDHIGLQRRSAFVPIGGPLVSVGQRQHPAF